MLPSLSGLTLHDEEPTGALGGPSGGITKSRDDRKADKARRAFNEAWKKAENKKAEKARLQEEEKLRKMREDWEEAEREEEEKARYQQMGRQAAAAAVDKKEPPGYPWKLMEARTREKRQAAARLVAEQARDGAVAARDREAAARRAAEQARDNAVAARDREAASRLAAEQATDEAQQLVRDLQGTDDGDAPMEAAAGPDALPPYRGKREQLQPPTSDRIEELRQHLMTDPFPNPTEANPDLDQVLPMGFDRLMEFAFVERGTEENGNNRDMSPAAVEKTMLERREKAWSDFITARDGVLNDPSQMRKWQRFQTPRWPLKIPLEKIRWETEKYLLNNFRHFADKKTRGEDVALQYLNNPRNYPAIEAGLYKAMQEQHRSDGQTIFVRTEKVQAVYEAVLDFCQADLKYEVTLARRRTWAALYAFMEEKMLERWPEGEPVLTPKALWKHAITEARNLPCFPTNRGKKFARVQVLMEEQVTQNIQWQYPYYNAYDLSRDDGIFGSAFKFVISKGPTMSLVRKNFDEGTEHFYVQHVHVPWEWMKAFLQEKATNLVRGLGNFCGTRFLVDEAYEKEKKAHDEKKNQGVPEELQTLPDPRTRRRAPLSMAEQRRLESSLSSRGFDEASRGAQVAMGTMVPNNRSISTGPMGISKLRPYGSLVPENYEFYDPYIEEKPKVWKPPDANWQPHEDWRPDIQTHRLRSFLLLHKKYYAYKEHQEIAQNFIKALEESEQALYFQAWKERELVGELLDPNGCLRDTPKRTAFTFSLTSGFSVAPHDDSGSALEHIVFTYPAHTELPRGHNPMFVASGVIMMLPGPVGRGPPGYKIDVDNLRACLCTVPGHNVNHGSMPTWTAEFYKKAVQARKRSELTLPKHFKCGSALITKVVSHMVKQRMDSQGNLTEFKDCEGLIEELNPRYANKPDMNVPKLMQLLYEGNTPYRDDPDPLKNDPLDTSGKVWSFDVRTQWLASYPKNRRKAMKALMLNAYSRAYKLTPAQIVELEEQEKQREEEEQEEEVQQRQREEEEEQQRQREEEEERRRREQEDEDEDEDGGGGGNDDDDSGGNNDDDSGGGDGGGGSDGDSNDDDSGGGDGGGAPGQEGEGSEDEEPRPRGEVGAMDENGNPVGTPPTSQQSSAQAGPSAAPMDVEGSGGGNDDDSGGGGDASEPEKGQSDPMDDNESGKAPPPIDGGLSDDSDDNVPLDQRSTTPTPPAQAGPSAAPMDVEGDGATKKRRRSKPPNRLGNYADDDDLVEINGRKVKDLIHWIKDQNLGNMKERAENEKERKHQLAKYERKRAKAQEEVDRNREDSAAKEALVLAQEAVQAVEKHIEVAERKLMEYDAQHPR